MLTFSATDLNRRSGAILDRAMHGAVTITRNEEHFALLRRADMRCLVRAATRTKTVVEAIPVAYNLILGCEIAADHPYTWLSVFDAEELKEFVAELLNAFHLAGSDERSWDRIDQVLHEWHESALAIQSPELAEAFSDESDEVPLTDPDAVSTPA